MHFLKATYNMHTFLLYFNHNHLLRTLEFDEKNITRNYDIKKVLLYWLNWLKLLKINT